MEIEYYIELRSFDIFKEIGETKREERHNWRPEMKLLL